MTSVKLFADKEDTGKNGRLPVYVQLIHKGKPKYINTDIYIISDCFDFGEMKCRSSHDHQHAYNAKLASKLSLANVALLDVADREFSPDELQAHIKRTLKNGGTSVTFKTAAEELVKLKRASGRTGNADVMVQHLLPFQRWIGENTTMTEVKYSTIEGFKGYLESSGYKPSTISAYLTRARTVFIYAQREGYIPEKLNPFINPGLVPAPNKGPGRAQSIETIYKLEQLAPLLKGQHQLDVHTVLMAFYMQGMDLADVVGVKHSDIHDGYYGGFKRFKRRSFQNQPAVSIKIIDKAKAVADHYSGEYLVPFLPKGVNRGSREYNMERGKFLNRIRRLSSKLELPEGQHLVSKSMRHTWLTRAANLKPPIPKDLRQKCVNHKMTDVTDGYTEYEQEQIDEANFRVTDTSHLNPSNNGKANAKKRSKGKD